MNHSSPEKNYVIHLAAFEKSLLLRNFHRQIYQTLQIIHVKEFVVIVVCSSSTQSQVIQMTPGKIWIH